jgi:hypothetical protein
MALYPQKSGRKRVETAVVLILLWLCSMGFVVVMEAEGAGVSWTAVLSQWWEVLVLSVLGLGGLLAYVVRKPH